jgi:hypothetical protein
VNDQERGRTPWRPTAHRTHLLDGAQGGSDFAEGVADFGAESCHGHNTDHRNQADKHAIFDQSRALVVPPEAIDKLEDIGLKRFEHVEILNRMEPVTGSHVAFWRALSSRRLNQSTGRKVVSRKF